MNTIKNVPKNCIHRMRSLSKSNPVLFVATVTAVTATTIGIIMFFMGDLLRSIGYALFCAAVFVSLMPDGMRDFLLRLFPGQAQHEVFPVLIGSNGTRIVPELVEEAFKGLSSCFESWYFMDASMTDTLIQYHFYVFTRDKKDCAALAQAIAEKVLRHSFSQFYLYYPDYAALTCTRLQEPYLAVTYARNEKGREELLQLKEQYRKQRFEECHPVAAATVITESWDDFPTTAFSSGIPYGYNLTQYEDYNVRMPVLIPLESHPHALIVGSSGSGKSKALLYMIGRLIQAYPEIDLWICDFKNSEDFSFLRDYPRYYAGNDCYQGTLDYYKAFTNTRSSGEADHRHLLVFDEYPACVLYYQGKDKQEKTKKAAEILSAVSEILMLGRGTGGGYGLWTVCQRASASIFPEGSRDNYMISLNLGRLSKEQQAMLFPGESKNIPDRLYQPGEGILLADGYPLQDVKFPLIANEEGWKDNIRAILAQNAPN